jgi:uncharacterized membrane protein YhhN
MLPLSLAMAAIDWFAVATNRTGLESLAKPAVMLMLGVWLLSERGDAVFGVGLGLSLVGDVLLLPPKPKLRFGLAAFLGAHLAYTFALNAGGPILSLPTAGIALLIAVITIAVARLARFGSPSSLTLQYWASWLGQLGQRLFARN